MQPEGSPFTPGQPVAIEFFVGRVSEIERLRSQVRASVAGKFRVGFVAGERGIGKSSLVSFVRHLTEREEQVAGVHVFLGGVGDLGEMVRRTFDRLLKESVEKPWHQKIRDLFGKYVKQVGLFGISIELDVPESDLQSMATGFALHLRKLLAQLKDDRKALLIILDDINGLAGSTGFANWLKSMVDEVATSSANSMSVCLLVVGLEERRQQLIQLQPSLARVFNLVEIRPWSKDETSDFFRRTFEGAGLTVETEALEMMVKFSGGLPVLAHEIGDAVWRLSNGPVIKGHEALQGVLEAAEIVGKKLLEPQVLRAVRSQRYRSILRKLARPIGPSFRRADLLKALSLEERKVCDNFLNRMRKLNVIVPDLEGGPGAYRFSNQLHALYFFIEAHRAKEKKMQVRTA